MNDFNTRFENRSKQFDKDFARARKWGIAMSILTLAFILGLTGFVVWVIVALLRFWGVV